MIDNDLISIINKMNKLLNIMQHYIRAPRKRTKKYIYAWQIFDRYSELIIVLSRIQKNLKQAEKLHSLLDQYDKGKKHNEVIKVLNNKINIENEIQFDIKMLYILANQIKNIIIEINKNKRNKIEMSDLDRICLIRHKFIDHISDYNQVFKRTGKLKNPFTRSHQIAYGGFSLGQYKNPSIFFQDINRNPKKKNYKRQLSSLTKKIIKYLPGINEQQTDLDKVNYLYKNLLFIPSTFISAVKEIIFKVGVRTDYPSDIAQNLYFVLLQYIKMNR